MEFLVQNCFLIYTRLLVYTILNLVCSKNHMFTLRCKTCYMILLLWFQDLRVDQEKKPYIRFTQENLIENSV